MLWGQQGTLRELFQISGTCDKWEEKREFIMRERGRGQSMVI